MVSIKKKSVKRILLMSSIFLLFALFIPLSSCEKRVTPNKLSRIITKDSWRITSFSFNGDNIASSFTDKTFGFEGKKEGSLTVLPFTGLKGSWSSGLNKKPTILYISSFVDAPYFYLNDDWTVVTCSKKTITLESVVGSVTNKITLTKVEE